MRFASFQQGRNTGLAVELGGRLTGLFERDSAFPGSVLQLLQQGGDALERAADILAKGSEIDASEIVFLPPIGRPGKILCIGLNYIDHTQEVGRELPTHPVVFTRFPSSVIGHRQALVRPVDSVQFDYEGEIVAVIGKAGRRIPRERALDHIAGYSIFNDGSVRDVQRRTSQWTLGKNFDASGSFGPFLVPASFLPPGCQGLRLETRVNGATVQSADVDDLIFDIATLVSYLSAALTLEVGDLIVTGTPSGVGMARKPPMFLDAGDVCEVEVKEIGTLSNPIVLESAPSAREPTGSNAA